MSVGLDEERSVKMKDGFTRRIAVSHFGCYCPNKRKVKVNSDEEDAIFAQDLPSALRLTAIFPNIYCELGRIRHLNIKLKLKLKLN
jgi:hypothetical protein